MVRAGAQFVVQGLQVSVLQSGDSRHLLVLHLGFASLIYVPFLFTVGHRMPYMYLYVRISHWQCENALQVFVGTSSLAST